MYKHYFLGLLMLHLFINLKINAQKVKVIRDLQGWATISLEKEIVDNLILCIDKEGRFQKNISNFEKHFTQVSFSYEKIKFLRIGTGLRFTENVKGEGIYEKEYRYDLDATLIKKFNRIKGLYRIRYQNDAENFFDFNDNEKSKSVIRNRVEIRYNIPKFKADPYFNCELFYEKNKNENPFNSKYRFIIGSRYDINKHNDIKLFLVLEREISDVFPYRYYIIGINYRYKI